MMLLFPIRLLARLAFLAGLIIWGISCLTGLACIVALSPFFIVWALLKEDFRALWPNRH